MKPETRSTPLVTKGEKRTFYDKRLIKKIVKEIEQDMPRSEAMSIYGMTAGTLRRWIQTYASAAYLNNNNRRLFKDS